MKTFRSYSYEQMEREIEEDFLEEVLYRINHFKNKNVFLFSLLMIGAIWWIQGFGWLMWNNPDGVIVPMDPNNSFAIIFKNVWLPILETFLFGMIMITIVYYRHRNKIKGMFIYNILVTTFVTIIMFHMFSFIQLIVYSNVVRVIHLILFMIAIIAVLIVLYKSAIQIGIKRNKKKSGLFHWLRKNYMIIIVILIGLGGINTFLTDFSSSGHTLEEIIFGYFLDYLPAVGSIIVFFFVLYMGNSTLRIYYLNKYQEAFRHKFERSNEEWYGKDYQKEKTAT